MGTICTNIKLLLEQPIQSLSPNYKQLAPDWHDATNINHLPVMGVQAKALAEEAKEVTPNAAYIYKAFEGEVFGIYNKTFEVFFWSIVSFYIYILFCGYHGFKITFFSTPCCCVSHGGVEYGGFYHGC